MADYHLTLLGKPVLDGPEGPLALPSRKGQSLLWYCAAQPDRMFARTFLADLLWGDSTAPLDNLNTELSRLRRALPVWPLRPVGNALGWDAAAGISVNTAGFARLLEDARHATTPAAAAALAAAVRLASGPFLDGVVLPGSEEFTAWLEGEREYWRQQVLGAWERLLHLEEELAVWTQLAAHARQALQVDPLREGFHRGLMLAHFRCGDRAAALAQFEACKTILRERLAVEPGPATLELREAIVGAGERPPLPGGATGTSAAADPPFLGREDLVCRVRESLARAGKGRWRLVLLQGEAGIGKTRLVEEVLREQGTGIGNRGTMLLGRCHGEFQGLPYFPVVEALNAALPGLPLSRLEVEEVWLQEVGRLVPGLAGLRPQPRLPPADVSGDGRQRLFEGLVRFLAALPPPILLVLEDLHWADETTLAFCAYLARVPAARGIVLLATIRVGEIPERIEVLLSKLAREGRLERREVPPLVAADVHKLTAAVSGSSDPELGKWIYAESGGVPLFAVELLRWERGAREERGLRSLPGTIQAVVAERLGRVAVPGRSMLDAVSLFPAGAALPLLQQVTGLAEKEALAAAEALLRTGFLRERDALDGIGGSGPLLVFIHEVVRRTVRDAIIRPKAESLHRRAYWGLVAGMAAGPDPWRAETLAWHAMAGGLWEEAMHWNLRAAEAAEGTYAYAAAARFLRQALDCLAQLPATQERRRQEGDVRYRLLEVEAVAQTQVEPTADPTENGREPEMTDSLPDPDGRRSEALLARIIPLFWQGRLAAAQGILDLLLSLVRLAGNRQMLALVLKYEGQIKSLRGDFLQAIPALEESIGFYQRLGHRLYPGDAVYTLAAVLATIGEFPRAEDLLREAARQEEDGGGGMASHGLLIRATSAHQRGNWAAAAAASREGIVKAEEGHNRLFHSLNHLCLGLPLARLGDLQEGMTVQEEAITRTEQARLRILLDRAYAWLAEIRLEADDLPGALTAAENGMRVAREDGYRYGVALNTRVLGQIANARGHGADARRLAADARRQFAALGARPELARCHALLAKVAVGAVERETHRRQAMDLFVAMEMMWDLERLQAEHWQTTP